MNPVPLFLIAVTLPLLLGGCGEKPFGEVKPVEKVLLNSNLKYTIKDGMVKITDCDMDASGALIIPSSIEGQPVTSIGEEVFDNCSSLTNIVIPNSVTSIGSMSFWSCTGLTSITIGDGVTSIGGEVFRNCTGLTSITIGEGVTSIDDFAFIDCNNLNTVAFLGDAPKIWNNAFEESSPTIYREADAKGWGDTFAGRPVKLITEKP